MPIDTAGKRYSDLIFVGVEPNKLQNLPVRDPKRLAIMSDRRLPSLGHFKNAGEVLVALEHSIGPEAEKKADRNSDLITTLSGSGAVHLVFNARSAVPEALRAALRDRKDILYYSENRVLNGESPEAKAAVFASPLHDLSFLHALIRDYAAPGATLHFCNFGEELQAMEQHDPNAFREGFIALANEGYGFSLAGTDYDLLERLRALSDATPEETFEFEVSLIIPLYNAEGYIETTLQSVVDQNFESLEVVVIDDGSSDSSAEKAKAFAKRFKSFVYRKQENQGVSAARNHGLALAKGKYIAFLDSDDLLLPDSIKKRYDFLETGQFRICGGQTQIIDDKGQSMNITVGRRAHSSYQDSFQVNCQISTLMGQSKVMKSQQFRVGQRFAEDWRYMVDLVAAGDTIGFCGDGPVSCYRWHAVSATGKEIINHLNACIELSRDLVLKEDDQKKMAKVLSGQAKPIDGSKVRSALASRVQGLCLNMAVHDSPTLEESVVDLMNGIKTDFQTNVSGNFFESTFTRIFLLPRNSEELHIKIAEVAPSIAKKLQALAKTPANEAFVKSFHAYIAELNKELTKTSTSQGVPVRA